MRSGHVFFSRHPGNGQVEPSVAASAPEMLINGRTVQLRLLTRSRRRTMLVTSRFFVARHVQCAAKQPMGPGATEYQPPSVLLMLLP